LYKKPPQGGFFVSAKPTRPYINGSVCQLKGLRNLPWKMFSL